MRLLQLRQQVTHGLVEVGILEGLCVVRCEGGDHGDDLLADEVIPVHSESEDPVRGVNIVVLHELRNNQLAAFDVK